MGDYLFKKNMRGDFGGLWKGCQYTSELRNGETAPAAISMVFGMGDVLVEDFGMLEATTERVGSEQHYILVIRKRTYPPFFNNWRVCWLQRQLSESSCSARRGEVHLFDSPGALQRIRRYLTHNMILNSVFAHGLLLETVIAKAQNVYRSSTNRFTVSAPRLIALESPNP